MSTYDFKNLLVWQKAMDLTESSYRVCNHLPKTEIYSLCDQIKRSAVSVPSNIAEGQKRLNKAETIQFTGIALGSVAELETQLLLCKRLYEVDVSSEVLLCHEVGKMLTNLVKSLRSKI